MDDTSFAKFILALDEHLQLFRRVVTPSRARRSLIETIQRGGLQQERERLGSVGRASVWERLWQGAFDDSPHCKSRYLVYEGRGFVSICISVGAVRCLSVRNWRQTEVL